MLFGSERGVHELPDLFLVVVLGAQVGPLAQTLCVVRPIAPRLVAQPHRHTLDR